MVVKKTEIPLGYILIDQNNAIFTSSEKDLMGLLDLCDPVEEIIRDCDEPQAVKLNEEGE